MAAKTKTASKTASKTAPKGKTSPKGKRLPAKAKADGYKGHRKGTLKEQLHIIFDNHYKKNPDKAREMALKLKNEDGLIMASTVNTSFSQFRTGKL